MKVDKPMPNFLAIDTSTDICSLAIYANDTIFSLNNNSKDKKNNQVILEQLQELLVNAKVSLKDLDAIILSAGPGSFTGLRVAASVAQSVSFANNIKVIRLSSLQIIAEFLRNKLDSISDTQKIYVAQDARKNEIYFAEYTKQSLINFEYIEEKLVTVDKLKELISKDENFEYSFYLGNAWNAFPELSEFCNKYTLKCSNALFPDVQYCFEIAKAYYNLNKLVEPHDALPIYIRNNVVN